MKYLVYESRISITAALFWSNHTIREQCCGLYNLLQPVLRWGLQSLSAWKCDHLQMLLQRQHYFTSHFKFTGLVPRIWPPRERVSWQGIVGQPLPSNALPLSKSSGQFFREKLRGLGQRSVYSTSGKTLFFFVYILTVVWRKNIAILSCGMWRMNVTENVSRNLIPNYNLENKDLIVLTDNDKCTPLLHFLVWYTEGTQNK